MAKSSPLSSFAGEDSEGQTSWTLSAHRRLPPSALPVLIETVQSLARATRPLTEEERSLLLSWPGWGGYSQIFEPEPKEHWQLLSIQVQALLGMNGFEAARAATPTSFFTHPDLVRALWHLAERLGFRGGMVLEPGCGSGQLFSYGPSTLSCQFTGIESEPFSAQVAQLLHPQAQILSARLQELALIDDAFDLIIGNIPFANVPIYDPTLPFQLTLHNYCIYRSLAALRPGGIAILVTSRFMMDALSPHARETFAAQAAFVGAIRLPDSAHHWAKTAVVSDIVVFRRPLSKDDWVGHCWQSWEEVSVGTSSIRLNQYFASHPEQILGTMELGRGMYHDKELRVRAFDADIGQALKEAIERIVEEAAGHESLYLPRPDLTHLDPQQVVVRDDGLKEGCFYHLPEVGLVQIQRGEPGKVTKCVAEISALVQLRDAACALLEAEEDYTLTDEALQPKRDRLNASYDSYVASYGPIRRSTFVKRVDQETGEETLARRLPSAMYLFRTDEHYPLVLSLEHYDDESKLAEKAEIFFRRVNAPPISKKTAESPEEAIALSLDQFGGINFPFLSKATGVPVASLPEYLGDLIFEDPETLNWEIAPRYLSGNVRKKLERAKQALRNDIRWQRNVIALSNVQPEPIAPEDIKVLLGAPWIPVTYIEQFCEELLKQKPEIARDSLTGVWDVFPPAQTKLSVEASSTWGTSRVSAYRLIGHLLNHKRTVVEDVDGDRVVTNIEETLHAQQKREELQQRFGEWVWEDQERTKTLAALYNQLYNGLVPCQYTGNHLSFPGMSGYWQQRLYSWQRDFIARMLTSRSTLCGYPVGAGKTIIQVAACITLHRMGLAQKATIVVPGHLLEQIAAEAGQLYPRAKILMISRQDLAREKRRIFLARIATGAYDLVVMTHGAFAAIDVHPATKRAFLQQQIRDYRQVLYSIDRTRENRADRRHIKRIEKSIQRLEGRLVALLSTPHDGGITFEQLGISYLCVDEAHFFKNLGLPTNQERLQVQAAGRAQDLLMKLRYLEQHNGSRPFASFFTATPVSNSMVEAFVMLWYLAHEMMKEYELLGVDDFASMFIESLSEIEVAPNGVGFRLYERPRRYVNLPEFMHLFGQVADIRSPEELEKRKPARLEHTVSVEPTPAVSAFVNGLVERSEALRHGNRRLHKGKPDNRLWITADGRMGALSLSLHGLTEPHPAKLHAITNEMAKIYHRWQEQASYLPGPYKSLQIGFCDLGTPSADRGDQVYGLLRQLLVEKGVPKEAIRFIHEANKSDRAKAVLFEQCRRGEVAILFGSTEKLGTGTNIQTRCAAIHHCDPPWRPDQVEQREGRGRRPGNLYPVVEIFYYVQQRTFDAYSWQTLANKARFFNQMRSTEGISREMEYTDDSALTYGQVKAAATGDVLLLEHATVALSVEAFSRMSAAFERARRRDAQEADFLRQEADRMAGALGPYQQIEQQRAAYQEDLPFKSYEGEYLTKEERQKYLAQTILSAVRKKIAVPQRLGYWQGVPIFFSIRFLSDRPLSLWFGDAHQGIEMSISPLWLDDEKQHWRFSWSIEQFFGQLTERVEKYTALIESKRREAAAFARQAHASFPHHSAWLEALERKEALERYIERASGAHSPEDVEQIAILRQTLLASSPKSLLEERPAPKNGATFVLPPRNPALSDAEQGPVTPIEVEAPESRDLSIEQVVRDVKRHVSSLSIGSKATVTFGNLEHIQQQRGRKKRARTIQSTKNRRKGFVQPQPLWMQSREEGDQPPLFDA